MTEDEARDELRKLFRVLHPDHGTIFWDSISYRPIVDAAYLKCRPHISITKEQLYDLATDELSAKNLNSEALSRLRAMCNAW